jgi:hypothetical protein
MKGRLLAQRWALLIVLSLLLHKEAVIAQSEWKSWNAVAVTGNFSKKWTARLAYLDSYNLNSGGTDFGQLALQSDYFINKNFSLRTGGQFTLSDVGQFDRYKIRYYLRGTHRFKLNPSFNWSNAIQLEHHLQQNTSFVESEDRYSERVIYITRLALNKRLKFKNRLRFLNKLALAPSVSYWLYYNIGGDSLRQYDADGKRLPDEVPNGFHRGRLNVNINARLAKNISLSLYYMNQSEFNFLTPQNKRINVIRPSDGRVYRSFDDYNVVGLTAMVNLKFYEERKPVKKKKSTGSRSVPKNKKP